MRSHTYTKYTYPIHIVGLRATGKPAEDADIFIAAYCVVNDYVLVTNNIKHFEATGELKTLNWKN